MCPSAVTRSPSRTSVTRLPDLHDVAGELVADREWWAAAALRPRIPVVDVHVGAADAGAANLDQYFVIANDRLRNITQDETRAGRLLHQRSHVRLARISE